MFIATVAEIRKAIHPARKITVYRAGDIVRVEAQNTGRGDIAAVTDIMNEKETEGFK